MAEIWLVDTVSRERHPVVTGAALNLQPCFTDQGKLLYVSTREGHLNVRQHDLATGEDVPVDPGPHSDQSPRALRSNGAEDR